jgi:hypothetical protein
VLRGASVVACLAVIALVGCGGSSETGTIAGNVTLIGGPVSLTDPHGGTPTSHRQEGRVMVLDAGGHTVASQRVQSGHGYRFEVAPNRYRLALVERGRRECPTTVRVRQGETNRANVTCQVP